MRVATTFAFLVLAPLLALATSGCGERNVPTLPGGVAGRWTRAQATAPGVASGRPSGAPTEKTWRLTTPQGVLLQVAATTGELDLEVEGKPEHARVPLAVTFTVTRNEGGWTVGAEAAPGPLPLLDGPFEVKVLQVSVRMRRFHKAAFGGTDVTEVATLELHGDGRLVALMDGTGRRTKIE